MNLIIPLLYLLDSGFHKITFFPERYLIWSFLLKIFIDLLKCNFLRLVDLFLELVLIEFIGIVHVAIMRKFVVYLGVGLVLRQLRRTVLRLLLDLIVVGFVEVQHLGLVLIVLLLQLRVEDVAAFDRVVLVDYLGNVCYL